MANYSPQKDAIADVIRLAAARESNNSIRGRGSFDPYQKSGFRKQAEEGLIAVFLRQTALLPISNELGFVRVALFDEKGPALEADPRTNPDTIHHACDVAILLEGDGVRLFKPRFSPSDAQPVVLEPTEYRASYHRMVNIPATA